MFETEELPDYEEYCDWIGQEDPNYADIVHDEFMIRGGAEIMHREIIDITKSELTIKDMGELIDYVWQGKFLIPKEMLGE